MKYLLLSIFILSICFSAVLLASAPRLEAAGINDAFDANLKKFNTGAGFKEDTDKDALFKYIGKAVNLMIVALGIIFLCLIIYGGLEWMQAMGNDEKVKKAQDIMRNAVIGLIIAVGAYALANFATTALGFLLE
ncbi:MAG: hypothetical protein WCW77_02810 [Patescibacteria group bacterium]|jgi:hypothetical protein